MIACNGGTLVAAITRKTLSETAAVLAVRPIRSRVIMSLRRTKQLRINCLHSAAMAFCGSFVAQKKLRSYSAYDIISAYNI